MARYGAKASKGAAVVKTVLGLHVAAASPRRIRVFEWEFGSDAAAIIDQQVTHIAQRATTVPTGAALVPNANDPADTIASTAQAFDTVTVDGTLTANAFLKGIALNMRNSFRWQAYDRVAELIIPATANNGIAFGISAGQASSYAHDALWDE